MNPLNPPVLALGFPQTVRGPLASKAAIRGLVVVGGVLPNLVHFHPLIHAPSQVPDWEGGPWFWYGSP